MNEKQTMETRVPAASERARLKDGVHIEYSPRRVRAFFDNQVIADSQRVLLVYETKRPPMYWFPTADVRMELLVAKADAAGISSGTVHWRSNTKGKMVDVKLGADTEYTRGKAAAKMTDLKAGDRVVIHAMEMKGALTAHLVQLPAAAKPAKASKSK